MRNMVRMESSQSNSDGDYSPCWQDIYDADCTMDSFSARFVPSEWIKELPCGSGMEVSPLGLTSLQQWFFSNFDVYR